MWLLENLFFFCPLKNSILTQWNYLLNCCLMESQTASRWALCKSVTWWRSLVTEIMAGLQMGGFNKVCFVGQINFYWCGQQSSSCISFWHIALSCACGRVCDIFSAHNFLPNRSKKLTNKFKIYMYCRQYFLQYSVLLYSFICPAGLLKAPLQSEHSVIPHCQCKKCKHLTFERGLHIATISCWDGNLEPSWW